MRYTRTDGQPQPVAITDLLELYLLPNLDLEVRLAPTEDVADELAAILQRCQTHNEAWVDLFDSSRLTGNNWWPSQTFALSDAPNICRGPMWGDEEGNGPSEFGLVWAFLDYQTVDEMELLATGQPLVFTRCETEPNDFYKD